MLKTPLRILLSVLAAGALSGLSSGCASPQMKGTPFYTGAETARPDAAEERVNVWPLFYYRAPALSVLWPLLEKTDDHFALRPLMSVYGLQDSRPVYNVLWPLARFDPHGRKYRVFPVFWSEKSATVFPLYWHRGEPFGATGGTSTMIPLWHFERDPKGFNAHVVWPFAHVKRRGEESGFRLWPLYGSYRDGSERYRFALWPLGHDWSHERKTERFQTLFPLYMYARFPEDRYFLSPLAAAGWEKSGDRWHGVLPLYFAARYGEEHTFGTLLGGWRRDGHSATWLFTPLLTGGASERDRGGRFFLLGPLAHALWSEAGRRHHALPFYAAAKHPDRSYWISLLYGHGSGDAGAAGWRYLMPVFLARHGEDRRSLVTLLGGYRREGNRGQWLALPALSGGTWAEREGSLFLLGPLAHRRWSETARSSHALPFYYRSEDADGRLFVSPLWLAGAHADGDLWRTVPLLYWHSGNERRRRTLTPLASWGSAEAANERWHTILPFYYRQVSERGALTATLLGGTQRTADGRRWLLYPLASWGSRGPDSARLWVLAPFFHWNRDAEGSAHHLLPFYYWDGRDRTFVSLATVAWSRPDGSRTTLIPPALSWLTARDRRRDLWALGPLAHFSWGEERGSHHVFPLYYRNPNTGTFASLPAARWKNRDGSRTTLIPPALSWLTARDRRRDLWALGPLAHFSWGEERGSHHVFPLYYRNPNTGAFLSLPYCRWKEGHTDIRLIPPALSVYWNDGEEREIMAALGLFRNRWGHAERPPRGHLLPLYLYRGRDAFYSPLVGWNRERDRGFVYPLTPFLGVRTGNDAGSWLFPLYSYTRDRQRDALTLNLLWGGYERDGARRSSGFFPLYGYRNHVAPAAETGAVPPGLYGKSFWSLPACWYKNQTRVVPEGETVMRRNGFFPLWSYARNETPATGSETANSSFLLFLYRHRREAKPDPADPERIRKTGLSSVLWYLWRKEREDDRVSVDVFPSITYDRRGDEFKRVTFLWRFFRYERAPDGVRLDLLFVPLRRPRPSHAE